MENTTPVPSPISIKTPLWPRVSCVMAVNNADSPTDVLYVLDGSSRLSHIHQLRLILNQIKTTVLVDDETVYHTWFIWWSTLVDIECPTIESVFATLLALHKLDGIELPVRRYCERLQVSLAQVHSEEIRILNLLNWNLMLTIPFCDIFLMMFLSIHGIVHNPNAILHCVSVIRCFFSNTQAQAWSSQDNPVPVETMEQSVIYQSFFMNHMHEVLRPQYFELLENDYKTIEAWSMGLYTDMRYNYALHPDSPTILYIRERAHEVFSTM